MLNDKCILVVDDDEESRDLLDVILRDLGAYVVVASSALEAERVVRVVRIDLAILDARIPDATPATLLRRLREAGHDVPAVALVTSLCAGAEPPLDVFDACLRKPVDHRALERALVSVLASLPGALPRTEGPGLTSARRASARREESVNDSSPRGRSITMH